MFCQGKDASGLNFSEHDHCQFDMFHVPSINVIYKIY